MAYGTHNNNDRDMELGRGEQVTEHYLPGAKTNYEKKEKNCDEAGAREEPARAVLELFFRLFSFSFSFLCTIAFQGFMTSL